MTVEEWRELERTNPDAKYEYIDGQVYLMSGGNLAHSRISSNTLRALRRAGKRSVLCLQFRRKRASGKISLYLP